MGEGAEGYPKLRSMPVGRPDLRMNHARTTYDIRHAHRPRNDVRPRSPMKMPSTPGTFAIAGMLATASAVSHCSTSHDARCGQRLVVHAALLPRRWPVPLHCSTARACRSGANVAISTSSQRSCTLRAARCVSHAAHLTLHAARRTVGGFSTLPGLDSLARTKPPTHTHARTHAPGR